MMTEKPVTVQQTGKKWKTLQLAGSVLTILGIVLVFNGSSDAGLYLVLPGIVLLLSGGLGAWWHHG